MSKVVKFAISIFVGVDIFVLVYLLFSQGRIALFGTGDIPGGGSALDMALFLLPVFIGYVAGDRLYHFLGYKQRSRSQSSATLTPTQLENPVSDGANFENTVKPTPSEAIWQDAAWDDSPSNVTDAETDRTLSESAQSLTPHRLN